MTTQLTLSPLHVDTVCTCPGISFLRWVCTVFRWGKHKMITKAPCLLVLLFGAFTDGSAAGSAVFAVSSDFTVGSCPCLHTCAVDLGQLTGTLGGVLSLCTQLSRCGWPLRGSSVVKGLPSTPGPGSHPCDAVPLTGISILTM